MRLFLSLIVLVTSTLLSAQVVMPATTQADWQHIISLSKNTHSLKQEDVAKYPIHKVRNEWYVSLLGKMKNSPNWYSLTSQGAMRGSVIGKIATVKIPLQNIASVPLEEVFEYVELPAMVSPHLNKVRFATRTDSVHQGINLPQSYTGENVLIGITDWGFDYTHPMFYDTLLQHTRIVAAWDQFKQNGNSPAEYAYGVEYDTENELLNAQCDTANIYGFATHGSHVAGIAAGSGADTPYRGMAPSAGLLFATFLIDAASVIDAFHWMQSKAIALDRRLVINMSWGLYYMGTLDGNSLLSQVIDTLSDEGVVFVTSAGNNGSDGFHIKKEFNQDTITTRVRFDDYSNPNLWGQSITMWGEPNQSFATKIGIYSNGNSLLTETPYYHTNLALPYSVDTLITPGNDSIFYNVITDASHPLNQRPHMRFRVKCTNPNLRVCLTACADQGIVHFWNVVELTTGVGNWGMPFTGYGMHATIGDSNYSISEPACAAGTIAVAAYSAEYLSGNTLLGGQLASFTSTGPLITEVMKPDIAAPGVSVTSSVSSFTDNAYASVHSITFDGHEYDFAKFSGTSMSSPCVAGIVALILEASPNLTPQEIKTIIQQTARLDNYTGTISSPGHVRWGYGKINAYKAIKMIVPNTGIDTNHSQASPRISPNPTNNYFDIAINESEAIRSLRAIASDGSSYHLPLNSSRIDCSSLACGLYILEITTEKRTYCERLIIQ